MKNPVEYLRRREDSAGSDNYDDIKCERLVKNYDGKSIEISGLNFGGVQLGKFGVEPKLLQTVSHALMLLDASQYDLCNSIKNIKDKETREKYLKLMTDDKLAAQRIYQALAGLLINPESAQMQDAVKETLLFTLASRGKRTMDIENSNIFSQSRQQQELRTASANLDHTSKQSTIELGSTSFKEKLDELKASFAQSSRVTPSLTAHDHELEKELEDIRNGIISLSNEYTTGIINGLNIVEFWGKLGPVLKLLTANRQYRKAIGSYNAEALDRIIIKIADKINEFKETDELGDRSRANVARKEVTLYFGEVFRRMDDIYSSISTS
jgi:hypothetical protein